MSDPYLSEVGLLLAQPSADAEKELTRVASLPDWLPEARHQKAVESAREWCSAILKTQFQPTPAAPFVPFDSESGLCDTIRCQYQAGGYSLHVAQTRYVICIQVRTKERINAASALSLVARMAQMILETEKPIELSEEGEFQGGKWGRRRLGKDASFDPHYPGWAEEIRWWCGQDRVSILTLKSAGGPTREVIHPALSFNRHWFPGSAKPAR